MSDLLSWFQVNLSISGIQDGLYRLLHPTIDEEADQTIVILQNSIIIVILTTIPFLLWHSYSTVSDKLSNLNQQRLVGTIVLNGLWTFEMTLILNAVLSWTVPSEFQQYNYIDMMLKAIQPFALEETALISVYQMTLMWFIRKLQNIWINQCGDPFTMLMYNQKYYVNHPGVLSEELRNKIAAVRKKSASPIHSDEVSEASSILEEDGTANPWECSFDDMMQKLDMEHEVNENPKQAVASNVESSPELRKNRATVIPELKRKISIEHSAHHLRGHSLSPIVETPLDEIDILAGEFSMLLSPV